MTLCVLPTCRTHADTEPGAHTCQPCRMHLVRQLADIEDYLAIVTAVPGRGAPGPHAKGYRSTPPLRLDVVAMFDPRTEINGDGPDDVMDEVPNISADLGGWLRVLMEEHPDWQYRIVVGGEGMVIAPAGVALLRSRCDWICRQPWVDEFAADVARVHGALRQACGDAPGKPLGRCLDQACGGEVFRRSDDSRDPRLRCGRCSTTYDGLDLVRVGWGAA